MRLLFVCSGNICRSPMAAEYARHRAAQAGLSHLSIDSAGTLGIKNAPASTEAVAVLNEAGLDLSSHRSRGLTGEDLTRSEWILVMEQGHLEVLERRFPARASGVYMLRAFEHGPDPVLGAPDLEDPIGRSVQFYRRTFECIRISVDHLVMHLRNTR